MDNFTFKNKNLKSWVNVSAINDGFSIYNLPFGIFKTTNLSPRPGVALGDFVIHLEALSNLGYLKIEEIDKSALQSEVLNDLMKLGKKGMRKLRNELAEIFSDENHLLRRNNEHRSKILIPLTDVDMLMPLRIGDYTDFYSSKEHATNVGKMFRDPENALLPNWLHMPVGYHGRASSIVVSGTPINRPKGQQLPANASNPVFGPSKLLDFELEMGFVCFDGKPLGHPIGVDEAEDFIFGMMLFNDWSARDIQKWEYVPLGPFLGKNFASSISPWIVSLDALEHFRTPNPEREKEVLPYLNTNQYQNFDIELEAYIQPNEGVPNLVCKTNFKYMYWSMAQQLAHHTINGCNIRCGDVCASGTISGPTPNSFGSMLEISWKGTKPIQLNDGSERKFLLDGDKVIMKGYCEKNEIKVGFGEVSSSILPAI